MAGGAFFLVLRGMRETMGAAVLMHFRTGRVRLAGNAGALARNEREARNGNLAALLKRFRKDPLRRQGAAGEGARVPSNTI